ncbi:MAG: GntR family transcriptional regulator [Actinomycetes bacterium]
MTRSGGAPDRIVSRLRERILSHDLPQGTRLSQADLAAQFGVSRIPVRDALRRLATEGLVDLPSRGSALVAPLTLPDLQELYELRGAIEPLACRLAVPHVGRAQRLVMAGCLERMEHVEESPEWLDAHATFHIQVYAQSGRPRMIALVDNLRRQTERYLRVHLSHIEATRHLQQEHHDIAAAVADGDPGVVERLVRDHLATSHDFILGHLLEREATGFAPRAEQDAPASHNANDAYDPQDSPAQDQPVV